MPDRTPNREPHSRNSGSREKVPNPQCGREETQSNQNGLAAKRRKDRKKEKDTELNLFSVFCAFCALSRPKKARWRRFDLGKTPPREQLSVHLPPRVNAGEWNSDDRYVFFQMIVGESNERTTELWTISISNGESKRTELSVPRMPVLGNMHVFGERVYFQAAAGPALNEVWVMENFLPPVAAKN